MRRPTLRRPRPDNFGAAPDTRVQIIASSISYRYIAEPEPTSPAGPHARRLPLQSAPLAWRPRASHTRPPPRARANVASSQRGAAFSARSSPSPHADPPPPLPAAPPAGLHARLLRAERLRNKSPSPQLFHNSLHRRPPPLSPTRSSHCHSIFKSSDTCLQHFAALHAFCVARRRGLERWRTARRRALGVSTEVHSPSPEPRELFAGYFAIVRDADASIAPDTIR